MADNNQTRPACDLNGIREAVCIHTAKVMDACRDKDCIEDLRVYLTRDSQALLDRANGARVRTAQLLYVDPTVEPVPYNAGYFTVTITYYYKVIGDATLASERPATVYGLAIFTKRIMLFGGDGCAKVFTSRGVCGDKRSVVRCNMPRAVVESVDPMVLTAKIQDVGSACRCDAETDTIPDGILACFDDELVLGGEQQRLYVTIGQFSLIRLERDTQLLIPSFDYCVPTKECSDV
ncbi:MAG: hypothetical protein IJT18_07975, partial [Oscillospiraceae bacterium]|nr:hypothetical protein [Oscillospiraceae bacterium]